MHLLSQSIGLSISSLYCLAVSCPLRLNVLTVKASQCLQLILPTTGEKHRWKTGGHRNQLKSILMSFKWCVEVQQVREISTVLIVGLIDGCVIQFYLTPVGFNQSTFPQVLEVQGWKSVKPRGVCFTTRLRLSKLYLHLRRQPCMKRRLRRG